MNEATQITNADLAASIGYLIDEVHQLKASLSDQPKEAGDLMTIKEASQFLKLSRQTIYQKTSRKELPFIKMEKSNRVLFSRRELNAWLGTNERNVRNDLRY